MPSYLLTVKITLTLKAIRNSKILAPIDCIEHTQSLILCAGIPEYLHSFCLMIDMVDSLTPHNLPALQGSHPVLCKQDEPMFYYFAYGSCMCPVDLKRSLGETAHNYVVGVARLSGYKLGFYYRSPHRDCGCLDIVKDANSYVEGVLYCLPARLSDLLDVREDVSSGGYQHELITVSVDKAIHNNVRTYSVVNKLSHELAPNDWYSNVVLRGASTCGLTEKYFWQLFYHIYRLQSYNHRQYG